ncbi:MAG: CPBP family glutamic-type intramembrane protease [Anaerolineae bacterium]|nr:CPBP family glutamic-type intramembrane protease [Anaerolineae bacterium]
MKDSWKQELRGFYSALAFALAIYLLFQSWEIALLFILSLGLHELGHALVAWGLGLEMQLGFGPLGAWMRTPLEQRRALSHFTNSLIHLAGPLASLGIAVVSLLIAGLGRSPANQAAWLRVANFNALICVLNLLPLGELSDGGKLVCRIFSSASEPFEKTLLAMSGSVPLVAAWILLTIRLDWVRIVALLTIVFWFALSMLAHSTQDDPAAARSSRAMSRRQNAIVTSVFMAALVLGTILTVLTPFWLTAIQAARIVARFISIATYALVTGPPLMRLALALAGLLAGYLAARAIARRLGWDQAQAWLLRPERHLFRLAQRGQRLPGWVLALTMSQVFLLAGSLPANVVILYLGFTDPRFSLGLAPGEMLDLLIGTPRAQVILLVLGFAPIVLLVWAWLAWYERRPFWTLGFERQGARKELLRGVLAGVGAFAAVAGLLALSGSVRSAPRAAAGPGLWSWSLPLLMILAWAVQGSSEEILFRGWLMPVIGARHRPWAGVLLTALSFALLHGLNLSVSWLALFNLLLVGLFFSLYALWEGGLWGVCGFHLAWNWAQGNLFGFEVSGNPPAGGALLPLALSGPRLLTGGGFGPEGGLAVTAVMLAGLAVILELARRDKRS